MPSVLSPNCPSPSVELVDVGSVDCEVRERADFRNGFLENSLLVRYIFNKVERQEYHVGCIRVERAVAGIVAELPNRSPLRWGERLSSREKVVHMNGR